MAIQTTAMKNLVAAAYGANAPYVALFSSAPGVAAGTEITGGSYARQAPTWSAASNGAITATLTFQVPAGAKILGAGIYSALTGGTYLDGLTIVEQDFTTAGQFVVTVSYTQQ